SCFLPRYPTARPSPRMTARPRCVAVSGPLCRLAGATRSRFATERSRRRAVSGSGNDEAKLRHTETRAATPDRSRGGRMPLTDYSDASATNRSPRALESKPQSQFWRSEQCRLIVHFGGLDLRGKRVQPDRYLLGAGDLHEAIPERAGVGGVQRRADGDFEIGVVSARCQRCCSGRASILLAKLDREASIRRVAVIADLHRDGNRLSLMKRERSAYETTRGQRKRRGVATHRILEQGAGAYVRFGSGFRGCIVRRPSRFRGRTVQASGQREGDRYGQQNRMAGKHGVLCAGRGFS